MKALDLIQKTREYLDYLEEHILNVKKAWEEVQAKCTGMDFIIDQRYYLMLDSYIKKHDISKLLDKEFFPYRRNFYPTEDEKTFFKKFGKGTKFEKAWEHHKEVNSHHWENWTNQEYSFEGWKIHCVHMIVDWLAMGYKFGDTPREYYENNKNEIKIPEKYKEFMYQVFERLEK